MPLSLLPLYSFPAASVRQVGAGGGVGDEGDSGTGPGRVPRNRGAKGAGILQGYSSQVEPPYLRRVTNERSSWKVCNCRYIGLWFCSLRVREEWVIKLLTEGGGVALEWRVCVCEWRLFFPVFLFGFTFQTPIALGSWLCHCWRWWCRTVCWESNCKPGQRTLSLVAFF